MDRADLLGREVLDDAEVVRAVETLGLEVEVQDVRAAHLGGVRVVAPVGFQRGQGDVHGGDLHLLGEVLVHLAATAAGVQEARARLEMLVDDGVEVAPDRQPPVDARHDRVNRAAR